jgi:hypothetical protein
MASLHLVGESLVILDVPAVARRGDTVVATYRTVPAAFPPLTTIRVLRGGTLWIRPTVAAGARRARWDVFSRRGQRLGRVDLPIAAGVRDGARDWVLVVEPGDDDVPSVVRHRVGA